MASNGGQTPIGLFPNYRESGALAPSWKLQSAFGCGVELTSFPFVFSAVPDTSHYIDRLYSPEQARRRTPCDGNHTIPLLFRPYRHSQSD